MELKLKGKESRLRTRLVRELQGHYAELVLVEQQQLIEEYGKRDEEGDLIYRTEKLEDGSEGKQYSIEDTEEFNKQVALLFNEYYTIEIDDNNREMIESLTEAILNYDEELSGVKALQYDRICDIFEGY